ncbi:DNA polymerase lambda-like [Cloeon dipterum]|uniref:DNA polymerase lambda-like n=1 Tax=Cloeon dipterum TaxID=197152 RepID=UPI00321F86CC
MQKGCLDGARVFLCPEGVGGKRRALFAAAVARLGGRLAPHPRGATHLVLEGPPGPDGPRPDGPDTFVVSNRWLSECIKQEQKVDEREFQFASRLSKRAAPQTMPSDAADAKVSRPDSVDEEVAQEDSAPNSVVIRELKRLATAYRNSGDQWRNFAYTKAISAIECHKKPIRSYEEALALPGLGEKMASKVWELLQTGQLKKTEELCQTEEARVLALFNKVWGVGPTTAQNWFAQGFRTLQDLQNKASLSRQQLIGLRYFEEINTKIPREEVEAVTETIRVAATKLEPDVWLETCGSFRRGKQLCGDIDVVMSLPIESEGFLQRLLASLKDCNFIVEDLSGSSDRSHKFLGICQPAAGVHRRLDLFVVPWKERACALVHYTGSGHFNRSLRRMAIKKNMVLSEHSLVAADGSLVPTDSENDVFNALGVKFRAPIDREHALEVVENIS